MRRAILKGIQNFIIATTAFVALISAVALLHSPSADPGATFCIGVLMAWSSIATARNGDWGEQA